MNIDIIHIIYLIGSVTFILGLKMLSNPKTARNGNLLAAFGMTAAIAGTIFLKDKEVSPIIYYLIFGSIAIGTVVGWLTAKRVQMTKMPELVSLFNGMGGACAALIGLIEFPKIAAHHPEKLGIVLAGMIIGSISFSGSMIAWAKLNGTLRNAIRLPKYNILNTIVLIGMVIYAVFIVVTASYATMHLYLLFTVAIVYGILFVIPIGGADMPVVISLLNSFTGLAAAFGGFLYGNQVMLTGGILVGSAGTLLTLVMCKAMNRPLYSVVFGAFGETTVAATGVESQGSVREVTASDLAVQMNYSSKVIIVPGYGLAVAQAQHVVKELETLLEERGVEVSYAIHPVAGRMPGHMNVLLAESNVDYDKLKEMEDVNPEFAQTDVVLVIGANDVVNPAAKTDPASPIYGMPILEVEYAKSVVVNKRSMNAGYAGIQNELFFRDKTSMLFGDAKKVLGELVTELKNLD
ncbi:MAG: NAD(P) transhydrogenase subunit beta [Bacteroidia bacterium]|jgi:NAD(P) transhydrogenase subunit beta